MILFLNNGKQIRGDLIRSAVLRSDLAPVPVTLEAEIRIDDDMGKRLAEGQALTMANGDALQIVKAEPVLPPAAQGPRQMAAVRIFAVLQACHSVAFVRSRAIIKEGATMAAIYKAAGATLKRVEGDFPAARFSCFVGDTPSFHIARLLQEEGAVVRWRAGVLQFFRIDDLARQKPAITIPDRSGEEVKSGFLEHHEIPNAFSLSASGAFIQTPAADRARKAVFAPFKSQAALRSMGRCLVLSKVVRTAYAGQIAAGDRVNITGLEAPLVVMTAAHVFESGTDGSGADQYSRLWLGRVAG